MRASSCMRSSSVSGWLLNACAPGLVGGSWPEVVEPVHRAQRDVADFEALQHLERHFDAGRATRPDLAVELLERIHLLAGYADHDVAALQPGARGGAFRRHSRNEQPAAHLLGAQSQPGTRRTGTPA